MKLYEVATIRSGLVLSRKAAKRSDGIRYPLMNLRCIDSKGYIHVEELDTFPAEEQLGAEYLTRPGDIVLRLSAPYTAILINDDTSGLVISSYFVVIRADERVLLPEYLFWLLNTAKVKRQIYENTSSNMLGSIKPRYFSEFEMALLPLADQKKIAELNALARKEIRLLHELADMKETYYSQAIDQIQKSMRKRDRK